MYANAHDMNVRKCDGRARNEACVPKVSCNVYTEWYKEIAWAGRPADCPAALPTSRSELFGLTPLFFPSAYGSALLVVFLVVISKIGPIENFARLVQVGKTSSQCLCVK